MRKHLVLLLILTVQIPGCGGPHSEPTVKAFEGQVVQEGRPVSFDPGKKVRLTLAYHRTGERFGVPLQPDGTFKIGWMPIGDYSATLDIETDSVPGKRTPPPQRFQLPETFAIEKGKTQYQVDVGKGYKP
jgi:hypothetical protein